MKINDIKIYKVKLPLKEPVQFSWEPTINNHFEFSLVIVEGEGVKGYSATQFTAQTDVAVKGLMPTLKNLDIEDFITNDRILELGSWFFGRVGPIEVALWDLIAKKENLPLYRLFRGNRKEVKIYASTGRLMKSNELINLMKKYYELGIDLVKIRFHRPRIEDDFDIIKQIRREFGNSIKIAVDANQAWSFVPPFWNRYDALKVAKELERYEVEWLEEPLFKDDIEGYAWLRRNTNIKIAGNELEYNFSKFKQFIDNKALDIIQADAIYSNGFNECVKIALLSQINNLLFLPHAWDPGLGWLANLHLVASLPENLTPYLETPLDPSWWFDEIIQFGFKDKINIENGYVKVPEKGGLGVELDLEKIKNFIV
ncbi:mandelate racemase [Sulfolobus sp. A20]|uniref:mandelate racemase/muconate lactonizing enzyme family protein n=1 Tax=Saccharolobus sp. A20 TaxID=1891280 RepID=UPI000845DDA3|nr:mandelate racemase/muconate lactonizing enzyme family protein [Sulfolobus sp. A20]TRM75317.1 mandelate racemase/muconate lactonizing enzyme family protein [Sulfolobus sp. A20-N-F8]TRM76151.1 mandelate racemase/muconate lactonizing enzyme family protein [Sulfolobus sp. E5]TRM77278.1 mandelate racemase/muconate lactonizing enzyme family protein [Sulfolobus sp. B5]TRM82782.1 mandelate racemase/muconate lactonizing enzyme family protein [Sulfolobus sp. A20-N-F6]TRM86281.1 mandelate racemase/muc